MQIVSSLRWSGSLYEGYRLHQLRRRDRIFSDRLLDNRNYVFISIMSMMNDVQSILWDAMDALHTEINVVTSTIPSPSRQESLDRLYKVRELIGDAWKESDIEELHIVEEE